MNDSSPAEPGAVADSSPPSSQPAVFAQHDAKLTEADLRMLAPGMARRSNRARHAADLSEATIMMVDDELLNIEMTEAFLGEAGYRNFIFTADSLQALPMLRERQPGVLLLDLSMPNIGGLEILAAMREDPLLRHVPVIVLTSTIDAQTKLKALSSGAMDFLSKPVDPSELALRIRNTLAANAYREFLAHHDAMTGLPNKLRYGQEVSAVLGDAAVSRQPGAVIHLGVDGLGTINAALGRASGDQVLQRIAKRIASSVETEAGGELASLSRSPTLFRFDGDEFAVVVPLAESPEALAAFISKLLEDSAFAFNREGRDVFVSCSIGIATFPQDGNDVDTLIGNAGLALRHARAGGRGNYEFFAPGFNQRAMQQLNVGAELRRAFSRDEIELLYEPRVDVETGKLVAAEAVVQWKQPSGRTIRGDELMELAANTDMAQAITEWLFEQVQRHLAKWESTPGARLVPIGIPLSLAHVRASDLPGLAKAAVRGGLEAKNLAVEVRRLSASGAAAEAELVALSVLRRMGFRVTLDRFGSGETSLSALRMMRFDAVKVDRSFAAALGQEDGAALLRGMLALLEALGRPSVVCGIDTMHQVAFLKDQGPTQCQGAAYGEALRAVDFSARWIFRRS